MITANYKRRCYLTISGPISRTCSLLGDHLGDLETSIDFAIAFQEAVASPVVAQDSSVWNFFKRQPEDICSCNETSLIVNRIAISISKLVKTRTSHCVVHSLSSLQQTLQQSHSSAGKQTNQRIFFNFRKFYKNGKFFIQLDRLNTRPNTQLNTR